MEMIDRAGAPAAEPAPFADGIYFGLDEAAYHRDLALGSSDLKRLAAEPADYWYSSPLNPDLPAEETTPSQLIGKAVHKLVLEGEQAFAAAFEREATGDDVLRTDEDMGSFLKKECGVEKLPRSKADKATLIRELFPELDKRPPILADIEAAAERDGRLILKGDDFDRIRQAAGQVLANPYLSASFTGGAPEVSIFWTEIVEGEAVRRKARFDYLKPRAVVDLKSVRPMDSAPFPDICRKAIANWGYHTQAAAYLQARAQVPALVAAGAVHGDHDPSWLAQVAASPEHAFVFVFWSSAGAPLTWGTILSPGNPVAEYGAGKVEAALYAYATARRRHGLRAPWIDPQPIQELELDSMPGWFGRV